LKTLGQSDVAVLQAVYCTPACFCPVQSHESPGGNKSFCFVVNPDSRLAVRVLGQTWRAHVAHFREHQNVTGPTIVKTYIWRYFHCSEYSCSRFLAVPLVYTYTGYLDSATEYEFLVKVFLLFLKRFLLLYLLLLVQLFSQSNGSTVGRINRNTVLLEGRFPKPRSSMAQPVMIRVYSRVSWNLRVEWIRICNPGSLAGACVGAVWSSFLCGDQVEFSFT
jgi:hypothetical protein